MSTPAETIREKLRRIAALAESGVGGERETAKRLLDELCRKHGVTLDALVDEEKRSVRFEVAGELESGLLSCVICHVVGNDHVKWFRKDSFRFFYLTKVQEIDAVECFAYYLELWKRGLLEMMGAFVNAHGIAIRRESGDEPVLTEEDRERIRRVLQMAEGIDPEPWKKRHKLAESSLA